MIKDLLWACVICGTEESLVPAERANAERCAHCGAEYRRGSGAKIVVQAQGREALVKPAGEWLASLPPLKPFGRSRAEVRVSVADKAFHAYGVYMGRFEQMGPGRPGWLELDGERLRFDADDGPGFEWKLLDLTAIQMSSSTLQLKARRVPLASIRFPRSSARLWEERLQAAVRAAYMKAGKGDVVEFQPRICTR